MPLPRSSKQAPSLMGTITPSSRGVVSSKGFGFVLKWPSPEEDSPKGILETQPLAFAWHNACSGQTLGNIEDPSRGEETRGGPGSRPMIRFLICFCSRLSADQDQSCCFNGQWRSYEIHLWNYTPPSKLSCGVEQWKDWIQEGNTSSFTPLLWSWVSYTSPWVMSFSPSKLGWCLLYVPGLLGEIKLFT